MPVGAANHVEVEDMPQAALGQGKRQSWDSDPDRLMPALPRDESALALLCPGQVHLRGPALSTHHAQLELCL